MKLLSYLHQGQAAYGAVVGEQVANLSRARPQQPTLAEYIGSGDYLQAGEHVQGAPPGGAIAAVPFTWREPGKGDGDGPLWLLMHLAVRDFFIYSALLHGPGQRPARAQCLPARPRAPAGGHALYLCGRLLNAAPT